MKFKTIISHLAESKRICYLFGGVAITALQSFALGTGGTLPFSLAAENMSTEIRGPLAYSVCVGMLTVAGLDAWHHRGEMSGIGKTMLGGVVVGGIAMGAGPILSLVPGVAGFCV